MTCVLELVVGPMFSGKTSRLVELYRQCKLCDMSVVAINYDQDCRYTDNTEISTHNGAKIPCISCGKYLSTLYENLTTPDGHFPSTILINEGQFFEDLVEWVKQIMSHPGVRLIHICGLDGDFQQKKFGNVLDLVPLCDSITKLKGICKICKTPNKGIFTKRIVDGKETELIGGSDKYISVCRNCIDLPCNDKKCACS